MIDAAALRLRACDLKLRHNILIKYQKEREKRRREWEMFNWGSGSKGKERELAEMNATWQCKPNRGLTTTNGVTSKTKIQPHQYTHTIHNALRQSHYSIQSRRTFVPSGVCNGSSETRKYCDWNQGKGLCGSRGWEAGACQVSLCVCCVGIDLLDIVVLYC